MPGRLHLRLTTRCNSGCAHCTIADIAHHGDRSLDEAWAEVAQARARGCDQLVVMRGEATVRMKDLVRLVRRAKKAGYTWVQLQTNARALAYAKFADVLVDSGVDYFEVSFFGHTAGLHDAIDGTEGAFAQASEGLRNLVARGAGVLVTVPVVRRNVPALADIARTLHGWGVERVQFNFSRPVKVGPEWRTWVLPRLTEAAPSIREALRVARDLGMVGTTEAVPLCHLDPPEAPDDPSAWGADVLAEVAQHQVADVHRASPDVADTRRELRPLGPGCAPCPHRAYCPTTWAAYQALFGTWELQPR